MRPEKPEPLLKVRLDSDLRQLPRSKEGWGFVRQSPCYIYSLCDPVQDKHYIGATGCLRSRIQLHKSQLRRGMHGSKGGKLSKLQEHYNQFGEGSLWVYLLEKVVPHEKGLSREKYYHLLYDSILCGFNKNYPSSYRL